MGVTTWLSKALNFAAHRFDYEVIPRRRLYEWQTGRARPRYQQAPLPEGAADYLRRDNPRLRELEARYTKFDATVTAPLVWTDAHVRPEDVLYFRGDNAYVWQLRGHNMNVLGYALATYYVKSIDTLGLMDRLQEDELFGNFTFRIDHRVVSRDLLDSIIEIYFLEKHLGLSGAEGRTILDIGAGYGRLAHRMAATLPSVRRYLCTDGVAVSSFLSEYYLRFRGVEGRAKVVPLDEVSDALKGGGVDLALNIHSFSECTIAAIDWWLALLERNGVKHLMVVPNAAKHGGERLVNRDGQDFGAVIEKHGYKLVAKEPKYRDPVVHKYAINPTHHYLFELR